jgi:hypothetical protein
MSCGVSGFIARSPKIFKAAIAIAVQKINSIEFKQRNLDQIMSNRSNWGKPEIRAVNRTDNYRNLNNPEIGTDAAANDSSKNSPTARKKTFFMLYSR